VSTHTRRTTESHPDTDSRAPPAPADAPAGDGTRTGGSSDADDHPATPPSDLDDARGDRSGTSRCQRLFSAHETARLRNLADAENHAMPDGV
jgi:hypothetical protein